MAKLSKARVELIVNNLKRCKLISYLEQSKDNEPEVDDFNLEYLKNVIESHAFFRTIGYESATVFVRMNGEYSTANISIFSQPPDRSNWISREIVLLVPSDLAYDLM